MSDYEDLYCETEIRISELKKSLAVWIEVRLDTEIKRWRQMSDALLALLAERDAAVIRAEKAEAGRKICIVFDGPPGPVAGRFVEVETPDGRGIGVGEWREHDDGCWSLDIDAALADEPPVKP